MTAFSQGMSPRLFQSPIFGADAQRTDGQVRRVRRGEFQSPIFGADAQSRIYSVIVGDIVLRFNPLFSGLTLKEYVMHPVNIRRIRFNPLFSGLTLKVQCHRTWTPATACFNPLFSGLTLKVDDLDLTPILITFQSPIFGADAQSPV